MKDIFKLSAVLLTGLAISGAAEAGVGGHGGSAGGKTVQTTGGWMRGAPTSTVRDHRGGSPEGGVTVTTGTHQGGGWNGQDGHYGGGPYGQNNRNDRDHRR